MLDSPIAREYKLISNDAIDGSGFWDLIDNEALLFPASVSFGCTDAEIRQQHYERREDHVFLFMQQPDCSSSNDAIKKEYLKQVDIDLCDGSEGQAIDLFYDAIHDPD